MAEMTTRLIRRGAELEWNDGNGLTSMDVKDAVIFTLETDQGKSTSPDVWMVLSGPIDAALGNPATLDVHMDADVF